MRSARSTRTARAQWVVLALALAAPACRLPEPEPAPRLLLVEKGPTQAFFDSQGRLLRLLVDADSDRRADTQTLYREDGTPLVAEIDTDRDGVVDRWERFAVDGALESVGLSRRTRGRPDAWDYPDRSGSVVRREYDDDGDGRVNRVERPGDASHEPGVEELDTDGNGKPDRRLYRGADGRIEAIEIDRNEDGVWERRELVRDR